MIPGQSGHSNWNPIISDLLVLYFSWCWCRLHLDFFLLIFFLTHMQLSPESRPSGCCAPSPVARTGLVLSSVQWLLGLPNLLSDCWSNTNRRRHLSCDTFKSQIPSLFSQGFRGKYFKKLSLLRQISSCSLYRDSAHMVPYVFFEVWYMGYFILLF